MGKPEAIISLILLVILTTSSLPASIAYDKTYDLSVVGVSPWYVQHYDQGYEKFVPGYRVLVANYGNSPSPEATMKVYIKTFDGKLLKRNFTVQPIRPGRMRSLKFSMANTTDGSFKSGYVMITTPKRWYSDEYGTYYELTYKNNARNFNLKQSMANNANLTVEEYVKINQTSHGTREFYTNNYTSPLSTDENITRIQCIVEPEWWETWDVQSIKLHVPGYMHENVSFYIISNNFSGTVSPTSWDGDTISYTPGTLLESVYYLTVTINGENLESKNTFQEPFQVLSTSETDYAAGKTRHVYETYDTPYSYKKYSYTSPVSQPYTVHNTDVSKLIVKGQPKGQYVAGWFIKPTGSNFKTIRAIHPGGVGYVSPVSNGYYGSNVRAYSGPVGFQIEGSNLEGFSSFKTYGFLPWTWKEKYD